MAALMLASYGLKEMKAFFCRCSAQYIKYCTYNLNVFDAQYSIISYMHMHTT